MRVAGGILFLMIGIIYPIAIMVWLSARLRRQPALSPQHLGVVLAFNGVFPLALIGLGLGLLSTQVWSTPSFQPALALVGLTALVLLLISWRLGAAAAASERAKQVAEAGEPISGVASGIKEGDDGRGLTGAGF